MCNNALYNIYTEDYSLDSIRNTPVTAQELIHEGVNRDAANSFLELSEKLYASFLNDVLHGERESDATLSVWYELLNLCIDHKISECDCSEKFPLYSFDIVLRYRSYTFPRDLMCFRMTLEQALSYESLEERRLEREYNIIFSMEPDE